MKEQAQLREEMNYLFKIGNVEVRIKMIRQKGKIEADFQYYC